MRLVALVEGPKHVCCRYRVTAFRPAFATAGYKLELQAWPAHWWSRLSLFRSLRGAAIVLLQRKLLQAWQLTLLRQYSKTLIFDFDDAVFLRDSHSKRGVHSAARLRRFGATLRAADMVVAGNPYLAEEAAKVAGSQKVWLIPTCLNLDRYLPAVHERKAAGIVLAWIGSASTLKGLEPLRPILEDVGRKWPKLTLKLICDQFFSLQDMQVDRRVWSETAEAAELASADIGISWLPDDSWSLGKCGLKILQYMAAGLPVVANPVGVQAQLVRHEETGLLASTPEEWGRAIERLAMDPELRRQMGRKGRQRVASEFSVSAGATRWRAVLKNLQRSSAA